MSEQRLRLGDMVVQAGLIGDEQLAEALESQKGSGRKLGAELVALGFVDEVQMTQILSNQLSVPWVSLYHVEFTRELLNLVPAQVAESCCAIPIYIRKVRREGDTLFVAMDDPTNEQAIQLLRDATQMPVKPMVAAPSEIQNAIRVYYFGGRPKTVAPPPEEPAEAAVARRAASSAPAPATQEPEPTPPEESQPAPSSPPAEPEAKPASEPAPPQPAPDPAPDPTDVPAAEERRPPRKAAPRMLTLTLLDGTSVRIPAPGSGGAAAEEEEEHELTAADLVAALLARGRGEAAPGAPQDSWETLFGTLLSLLIRKGLIADWEFVEELAKNRGDSSS